MKLQTRFRAAWTLAVLVLALAGPAAATTYNVDRFDDSTVNICSLMFDDCALRGAIIAANSHAGDDIVRLHTGTYALSIAGTYEEFSQTGDLDVRDRLTIVGDGPNRTIIDAAGIDRVLHVLAPDAGLTLRGVTIKGGNPAGAAPHHDGGAGIRISEGWLHVESCVFIDNVSNTGTGGAISDFNAVSSTGLTIIDSWISGNHAAECGGVYGSANSQIDRSTISENTSTNGDGAVCVGSGATLSNSTIAGNVSSNQTGGVVVLGSTVTLTGCTIAGNTGAEVAAPYGDQLILANNLISGACLSISPITLGGNLESPGDSCGLGGFDIIGVGDPMLAPLGWHGGGSPVLRPLPGSPVVDHPMAGPNCPLEDQRGLSRPRDGGGTPFADCDIGAVELAGAGEIFVESFESGFLTSWFDVVR